MLYPAPQALSQRPVAVKSLFCESGTYQPMALRTYQSSYTNDITSKVLQETDNGKLLGKNSLANLASEIITPSTAPSAQLTIDEGWGTKRFTFVMEIKAPVTTTMGNDTSVVLTGYTNYTDVSLITKQFDPNMRLYFNSSNIVDTLTTRLPNGQLVNRRVLKDASHLLTASVINNIVVPVNNGVIQGYNPYQPVQQDGIGWLLPKNIIEEMQNQQFESQNAYSGQIIDLRRMANPADALRSKRENAVTGSYLDRIISSVTGEFKNNYGTSGDDLRALSEARYATQEVNNYADRVFSFIMMNTNFIMNGYVTWAELCSVVDALDERTVYTLRDTGVFQTGVPEASTNNSEHWQGQTYETMIANSISQLVPAIMTSSLIGNISFMFTNDNPTLTPELTVLNGNVLIDGLDMAGQIQSFTHRFNNEVYPIISNNARSTVSIIVHSNIGTETHISVSYNGGPTIPYCAPTFCDAMYSPIVAPNIGMISDIASDLYQISSTLSNSNLIY